MKTISSARWGDVEAVLQRAEDDTRAIRIRHPHALAHETSAVVRTAREAQALGRVLLLWAEELDWSTSEVVSPELVGVVVERVLGALQTEQNRKARLVQAAKRWQAGVNVDKATREELELYHAIEYLEGP